MFLLIVFFWILQYIFDMDFVCSCRPGIHGELYLAAPPMILTLVVNIIEPFLQTRIFSSWGCLCCSRRNNFCSCLLTSAPVTCLLHLMIKYFSFSAVWVATVLFDGDWYFCLMTNLNMSQTGIPCKEKLTYEEQRIKDAYRAESLVSNYTQQPNRFISTKVILYT